MNKIRLAGIIYESLVNGPGMRRVYFSQGCKHNCKGCHNQDSHDFNGGEIMDINELIADLKDNTIVRGVTFSGGDPFEQADKFTYMAIKIKELGLNIWCYTGYTFEELMSNVDSKKEWLDLLQNIDVLVDGRFDIDKMQDGLKFRGSTNQRIINVPESLRTGEVILQEGYEI